MFVLIRVTAWNELLDGVVGRDDSNFFGFSGANYRGDCVHKFEKNSVLYVEVVKFCRYVKEILLHYCI